MWRGYARHSAQGCFMLLRLKVAILIKYVQTTAIGMFFNKKTFLVTLFSCLFLIPQL
jgi:hypothetical protein